MLDFISLTQLSNYLSIYTDLYMVINVLSSLLVQFIDLLSSASKVNHPLSCQGDVLA